MNYTEHIRELMSSGKKIIVVSDKEFHRLPNEVAASADVVICAGKIAKDRQGNHVLVTI
jgi:hypothetical protein